MTKEKIKVLKELIVIAKEYKSEKKDEYSLSLLNHDIQITAAQHFNSEFVELVTFTIMLMDEFKGDK